MPADYARAATRRSYAQAIKSTLPMFTTDGVMPEDGPETVEQVLKAFNPNLQNADVDLSKTYTTEFVDAATERRAVAGARRVLPRVVRATGPPFRLAAVLRRGSPRRNGAPGGPRRRTLRVSLARPVRSRSFR